MAIMRKRGPSCSTKPNLPECFFLPAIVLRAHFARIRIFASLFFLLSRHDSNAIIGYSEQFALSRCGIAHIIHLRSVCTLYGVYVCVRGRVYANCDACGAFHPLTGGGSEKRKQIVPFNILCSLRCVLRADSTFMGIRIITACSMWKWFWPELLTPHKIPVTDRVYSVSIAHRLGYTDTQHGIWVEENRCGKRKFILVIKFRGQSSLFAPSLYFFLFIHRMS